MPSKNEPAHSLSPFELLPTILNLSPSLTSSTPAMSSSSPYFNADKNGGRQAFKPLQPSSRRNGGKRNTSILNFFKKSETPPKSSQKRITNYIVKSRNNAEKSPSTNYTEGSESLFFTEEGGKGSALGHPIEQATGPARARSVSPFGGFGEAAESFDDGDRYNENYNTGQKRQKVDKSGHIVTTAGVECLAETGLTGAKGSPPSAVTISNINRIGPFLDESDSEEESNCAYNKDSLITRTQTGARNNEYDFIPPTDSSNESHDNSTMKGVTFAAASGYLSSSEDADSCELQDGGSLYGQSRERYDEPQEGFGKTTSIEKIDLDASGLFYDDNIAICPICSKCLTGITDNVRDSLIFAFLMLINPLGGFSSCK